MAASMENVYTSVFQVFATGNLSLPELQHLTETIHESQLLTGKSSNNLQEILSYVHDSLTKTKQRPKGLQLLKLIVCQCSTDVFQQNAEKWIRLLLQILQGHSEVEVYRTSLQVLGDIFEHARNFTDVSRMIVNNTIQELGPILLKPFIPKVLADNIRFINRCVQAFPGPLGPFKGKIEALVYDELSSNTKSKAVYRCFALLNQCGPGGTKGIKHTESWSKQCSDLLGSLEVTLGSLYDGFETDKLDTNDEKECLPLTKTSSPLETNPLSSTKSRWVTLCGCLEALIGEEMDAIVRIPVDRIVQLICRTLAVNCKMVHYSTITPFLWLFHFLDPTYSVITEFQCNTLQQLSKPTTERMLLASYLSEIHRASLSVLEQMIITCRKNLLPHCAIITSVLSQELLWSKSSNTGYNMTFGILRKKAYTVMSVWLRVLDGCAGVNQESKTWVEQILHDCAPYTESFKLNTTLNKSTKPDEMPKKKKKKGFHEISQGISTQKKIHVDANCSFVQTGLEALYWLITTSGPQLDRKSIQAVQSFIIKTLLAIQQTIEKQSPIPYSKPACRKSLYRVLLGCVINTHPQAPPPTQCALRIFSNGHIDRNLEVSSFCIEALRICEGLIHPRAPVLNGPIICESVLRIGNEPELTDKTQAVDINSIVESETNSNVDMNNQGSLKRPLESNVTDTGNAKVMKFQSELDGKIDKSKHKDKEIIEENSNISSKQSFVNKSEEKGVKDKENRSKFFNKNTSEVNEEEMKPMKIVDSESGSEDNNDSDDNDSESVDKSDNIKENENAKCSESRSNVDDRIEPCGDAEVYIATKCDVSGDLIDVNIEDQDSGSMNELDEEDNDDDVKETSIGAANDLTKEHTKEENHDEEVATMMLSFIDASPDSD